MYTVVRISETELSLCSIQTVMCGGYTEDWEGDTKIIPSCVVSIIRKEFPEADGNYTGFKDPSVTEAGLSISIIIFLYSKKFLITTIRSCSPETN